MLPYLSIASASCNVDMYAPTGPYYRNGEALFVNGGADTISLPSDCVNPALLFSHVVNTATANYVPVDNYVESTMSLNHYADIATLLYNDIDLDFGYQYYAVAT